MAKGKGGLGRGLESLFEDATPALEGSRVEQLPLWDIEPDPAQPRKTLTNQELRVDLGAALWYHLRSS